VPRDSTGACCRESARRDLERERRLFDASDVERRRAAVGAALPARRVSPESRFEAGRVWGREAGLGMRSRDSPRWATMIPMRRNCSRSGSMALLTPAKLPSPAALKGRASAPRVW